MRFVCKMYTHTYGLLRVARQRINPLFGLRDRSTDVSCKGNMPSHPSIHPFVVINAHPFQLLHFIFNSVPGTIHMCVEMQRKCACNPSPSYRITTHSGRAIPKPSGELTLEPRLASFFPYQTQTLGWSIQVPKCLT